MYLVNIDKLILELQRVKEEHGNLECVVEIEDFYWELTNSTVVKLVTVMFHGNKAVKLDWRTY